MFTVTNDIRRKTEAVGRKRRKRWTGRKRGSIAKATTVGAVSTRSSRRKWRTRAWKRIISRRSRRKQRQKSATNLQGGNRKRFENRTFLRIARRPLKEGPFSPRHLKFPSNLSFLIYYHFFFLLPHNLYIVSDIPISQRVRNPFETAWWSSKFGSKGFCYSFKDSIPILRLAREQWFHNNYGEEVVSVCSIFSRNVSTYPEIIFLYFQRKSNVNERKFAVFLR